MIKEIVSIFILTCCYILQRGKKHRASLFQIICSKDTRAFNILHRPTSMFIKFIEIISEGAKEIYWQTIIIKNMLRTGKKLTFILFALAIMMSGCSSQFKHEIEKNEHGVTIYLDSSIIQIEPYTKIQK